MAANTLGGLIVTLGLNAAEFVTGLTKSERQAQQFAKRLDQGIATAARGAAIGLAAVGAAALATALAIDRLAKQAGAFQDLAEITGANAESLASFAVSAAVAGVEMSTVAEASVKLTKSLTGVDDESKAAGAALTALGLSIKEFKALDPATQIETVAKALSGFEEGAGKTAVAVALLGKSGAQLLPFLKELGQEGGRQVILTQKQIELADEYADKQARAVAQLRQYAQAIATEALPAVNALTKATIEFVKDLINVDTVSKKLRDDNPIAAFAEKAALVIASVADKINLVVQGFRLAGTVIGATVAQLDAIQRFDFSSYKRIQEQARKDIAEIAGQATLVSKLEAEFASQRQNATLNQADQFAGGNKPKRPQLNFAGAVGRGGSSAASDANAEARRILDGQIKALEASAARERDILGARESFLRDSFTDGLLSVSNYYSQLQAARDANLEHAVSVLAKEIAARKLFAEKLLKSSDKQAEQNKIDDLLEKQDSLVRNARFSEEALSRDRDRAAKQYSDQLAELNAKMEELAGNTAKAASIRFDIQNSGFERLLKSSNNAAGVAQLASIKAQEQVQKQLNDESKKYQLIIEQGAIAQERINIARDSGAIGELESLARTSAANKALLPLMQARIDALAEIAAKSQDPADLLKVEQLRVAMERLGAQTDLVKDKFNNIFAGAFSDAIAALADGTKSFKDAAKDLGKSIASQINKIAADEIAGKLFGKDGALSGIGGIFSKLFGGEGAAGAAGGAAGAASTAAAATALTGSATTLTAAAAPLAAAGGTLTGAGGTLAGSGGTLAAAGATLTASGATLAASGGVLTAAGAALSAAAAALTASAATSAASGLGDIFGSALGGLAQGGGLAGGTDYARGGVSLVGERGPELVNMPRGAQVIPNDVLMAKRDQRTVIVNQHINVMPGASTQSAMQAANMAGQQARRAVVRNG